MTTKGRSPNYPSMDLGESIEAIKKVYAIERRARFPRTALATHLGYTSLNGRALAKIGAIRAYGLLDGREDSLTVSPTAMALIDAPKDSEDYLEALHIAFNSPPLFARIAAEHEETPSPQSLRWWLAKQGYMGDAADKALKVYLASLELVNSVEGEYRKSEPVAEKPSAGQAFGSLDDVMNSAFRSPVGAPQASRSAGVGDHEGLAVGVHERVLQSGMLSKSAGYRVIVSGHIGAAEIDRLLRKLEMDREILADPSDGRPDEENTDLA